MRKILFFILILLCSISLFGCANGENAEQPKQEEQQEEETDSMVYKNTQYGFHFSLPESWKEYMIVTNQWEGLSLKESESGKVIETGPIIYIRHPQWTSQNPQQDIPIMIFTLTQWEALKEEEFHIGAAPVGPSELGHNSKYIFALPARYNFEILTGYEEVEDILKNNPLQPIEDNENKVLNLEVARPASLGGICLGDSYEDVVKILGKNYVEFSEIDDAGYIDEGMVVWDFNGGIVITFGEKSGKVIKVTSHHADFQTDLGMKVGDEAKVVFEKYKPAFEEVISRHDEKALAGWFHIEDENIIIFDFDKEDKTRVNKNVGLNSTVQEIVLAYERHFD